MLMKLLQCKNIEILGNTPKQPPKTFKPQIQIFKFFTPVQKQVPASSEQLPSLPNNLVKNQEAPASGLTGEKSREGEKMPNAKRNFEQCKKALTQKHEREKGCWGRWGWRCCRTAAREGIWTSNCDATPHESLNKEAVLRLSNSKLALLTQMGFPRI